MRGMDETQFDAFLAGGADAAKASGVEGYKQNDVVPLATGTEITGEQNKKVVVVEDGDVVKVGYVNYQTIELLVLHPDADNQLHYKNSVRVSKEVFQKLVIT